MEKWMKGEGEWVNKGSEEEIKESSANQQTWPPLLYQERRCKMDEILMKLSSNIVIYHSVTSL
jgi:hypothetical protein